MSTRSLTATTSTSGARSIRALSDCRPIRPKPLIPTRTVIVQFLLEAPVRARRQTGALRFLREPCARTGPLDHRHGSSNAGTIDSQAHRTRRGRSGASGRSRTGRRTRPDRQRSSPRRASTSGWQPARPTSRPSSAGTSRTRAAGTRNAPRRISSRAGPRSRSPWCSAIEPPTTIRSGLKALTKPAQAIANARRAWSISAAQAGSPASSPSATARASSPASASRPGPSAPGLAASGARAAAARAAAARAARKGELPSAAAARASRARATPLEIASRWPEPPHPQRGPSSSIDTWPSSPAIPSGPWSSSPAATIAPPTPVETVMYRKSSTPRAAPKARSPRAATFVSRSR